MLNRIRTFASGHRRLSATVIVLCVLWIIIGVIGGWNVGVGLRGELESAGNGSRLVVLVHGLGGNTASMDAVKKEMRKITQFKAADFYQPRFMANPLSNTDPSRVASLLEQKIHSLYEAAQYDEIVLVGHSMGDLLLRQAYLNAADRNEAFRWASKVTRVVSLAGINRGWSLDASVEHANWTTLLLWRVGSIISDVTLSGDMAQRLKKGSPFVANLRVQWMRFVKKREDSGLEVPLVVQLLGDQDDVISREDALDLGVSKRFHAFLVGGAGHGEILDFASPQFGTDLAEIFRKAVTASEFSAQDRGYISSDCVNADGFCRSSKVNPNVKEIIMVRHGIRDLGDWGKRFEDFFMAPLPDKTLVHIDSSSYQRMPLAPFLLFNSREQRVNEFMDQYTQLLAKFPNAEKVHFVGHSNGTYLLARALEKYQQMHINRVVFAGTVTPRAYAWRKYLDHEQRVDEVLNFVGKDDLVVGIFPRLFELIHEQTGWRSANFLRLGSAGFAGYHYDGPGMFRIDGLGGHGWAVGEQPKFTEMASFLRRGGQALPKVLGSITRPGLAGLLSNLCWLIWLLLAVIVLGIGTLLFKAGRKWSAERSDKAKRYAPAAISAFYAAFVLAVLHSA